MNNLFYSLEDGKYYTYPDGDEATGIQIREVIEANERSISKLQQETEKLKKQYCERTDCGGRIGNSKKVEELQRKNKQLKEIIKENTILVKDEYGDYQECNINPLGMKQKYEKQVDNWNKLKEYIKETKLKEFEKSYGKRYGKTFTQAEIIVCNMILNKMQELERGISDVED